MRGGGRGATGVAGDWVTGGGVGGAQVAEEEDRDMDVAGWRKAAAPPVPLTPTPTCQPASLRDW